MPTSENLRHGEVLRTPLLGTPVKLRRGWRTRRNLGTSVRRLMLEDFLRHLLYPATTYSCHLDGPASVVYEWCNKSPVMSREPHLITSIPLR
jgi:hypothetical protein